MRSKKAFTKNAIPRRRFQTWKIEPGGLVPKPGLSEQKSQEQNLQSPGDFLISGN